MKGLVFLLVLLFWCGGVYAADTVYVEVQRAKLKSEPKYWAKTVTELEYGAPMQLLEEQGDWLKVRLASVSEAFIHRSAVTSRTVILTNNAGAARSGAAGSDVVLAGKGFTAEIEGQYRLENPQADFEALDKALSLRISDQELKYFAKSGALGGVVR